MFWLLLLLLPLSDSMVIRRCDDKDSSVWELDIGICVKVKKGFISKRTECSVYRPDIGGGLITKSNGIKVVVHDKCVEPGDFIITTTKQAHFGITKTYIKLSNHNIQSPENISECSKNILVSVYCEQDVSELDFNMLNYVETDNLNIKVKYDISCIDHIAVNYNFMNKCSKKLSHVHDRDILNCGAPDVSTRDKYLKTCSNDEFNRIVYKKYIMKSKNLHSKTEL
ncbi:virulence factor [Yokapox virus]|uniref:Myxoma MT-4-like protein n=1 Tax=Yokapox virus TaxID=1076255 RepID=G3EI77_9POXV|nr:myxoma MT-4-like protein [Yokapox virus]YP_004821538.1 virulence factor [Yokapox virus]AEN03591.1 myxoma MT-4-like protein [Yokapox virus]AEN03774.1 virulence factor [Yokapox virus]